MVTTKAIAANINVYCPLMLCAIAAPMSAIKQVVGRSIEYVFQKRTVIASLSGITSAITGHERKSNHFAPARMSAPCASHCYTAFAAFQLLMLDVSLYRAALSRSSMFRRKSWIQRRPPRGNRACREYGMERGEHVTNPHEHVTNLSECVANMSRTPTITSVPAPEAV